MSAVGDSLLDPGFHFFRDPSDPASSERDTFWKTWRLFLFEPRDVRGAIVLDAVG